MIDSKDYSDADCHNGPLKTVFCQMCSCSTTVDGVLIQCHNSLNPRLSVPDFFVAALEKNRNGKPWLKASVIS